GRGAGREEGVRLRRQRLEERRDERHAPPDVGVDGRDDPLDLVLVKELETDWRHAADATRVAVARTATVAGCPTVPSCSGSRPARRAAPPRTSSASTASSWTP